MIPLGRYSHLMGENEVTALTAGMDFRMPRYRREVFHRFYEFHLKYRAHPGCVYYLFPYLRDRFGWDAEACLWFAFLNGNTQNPCTSYAIAQRYPDVHTLDETELAAAWPTLAPTMRFDTDRRYFRVKFMQAVSCYRRLLKGQSQVEFFKRVAPSEDPYINFRKLWPIVTKRFAYFGRLSAFSYLEYLSIMGVNVQCDRLFLEDISGSRSHRNGICKVLGRDDLDWHETNPTFTGKYSKEMIQWLTYEGQVLLEEAQQRAKGKPWEKDVGYFTMESALCTYKSWHRPNRRYPNVYNDMLHDRIKQAETDHPGELEVFWEARKSELPEQLRLEVTNDCGLKPPKQNHYRETGQVIMMDLDWSCFANDFNGGR